MRVFPLVVMMGGLAVNAFCSLILTSTTPTIDVKGTGLGAVNTVLSIASPNSTSDESGCVAPTGSGAAPSTTGACAGFADSTVLTGASQIGTPTLSSVGIASASQIGVVLNALEPGNDANSITVNNVALTLYGTGGVSTTFGCDASCLGVDLPSTLSGNGASGFLFMLDAQQAQAAAEWIAQNGGYSGVIAALGASLSNATGGHETFYMTAVQSSAPPPTSIPEPGSIALIGGGLIGVAYLRKFRLC